MKKKKLSDKDLSKFSGMSNIDLETLHSLDKLGALDVVGIHSILIKSEYKRLVGEGKYTCKQVAEALANKYGISRYRVETLIYNKETSKSFYCKECGGEMTRYKFSKNKGVCDNCIISNIGKSI